MHRIFVCLSKPNFYAIGLCLCLLSLSLSFAFVSTSSGMNYFNVNNLLSFRTNFFLIFSLHYIHTVSVQCVQFTQWWWQLMLIERTKSNATLLKNAIIGIGFIRTALLLTLWYHQFSFRCKFSRAKTVRRGVVVARFIRFLCVCVCVWVLKNQLVYWIAWLAMWVGVVYGR